MGHRGTSNTNDRGSSLDRRRRREYLVTAFGDGEKCPCYRCGKMLDVNTVTSDRIIPGCEGGRYIRSNIRPACGFCNSSTGSALGRARRGKLQK